MSAMMADLIAIVLAMFRHDFETGNKLYMVLNPNELVLMTV